MSTKICELEPVKKISVSTAQAYKTSPFMAATVTKVRGKKKFYDVVGAGDRTVLTNTETGEIMGGVEHKVVKLVDDALFVKVFVDGIAGIYDLSRSGNKVFRYLFDMVQENPNCDRIYLYFMNATEEPWSINKDTFFRGMAELLSKNFIAKSSDPNMFFLNPLMLWNGNRFKFVTEYVRSQSPGNKIIAKVKPTEGEDILTLDMFENPTTN